MFKCGICGKEFETVEERAKHEAECIAHQKEIMRKKNEVKEQARIQQRHKFCQRDIERIKAECQNLIKDIQYHNKLYGDNLTMYLDDFFSPFGGGLF